jgi:hypothetical protein
MILNHPVTGTASSLPHFEPASLRSTKVLLRPSRVLPWSPGQGSRRGESWEVLLEIGRRQSGWEEAFLSLLWAASVAAIALAFGVA